MYTVLALIVAFGGWLWANFAPGAALHRLTFKRVLYIVVLILVITALARIGSSDLAFVWAGDAALYFEVASAVMFFAVRGHIRHALHIVERKIWATGHSVASVMRRFRGAVRQRRNANALRRKNGTSSPKRSDDEPAAWGQCALS